MGQTERRTAAPIFSLSTIRARIGRSQGAVVQLPPTQFTWHRDNPTQLNRGYHRPARQRRSQYRLSCSRRPRDGRRRHLLVPDGGPLIAGFMNVAGYALGAVSPPPNITIMAAGWRPSAACGGTHQTQQAIDQAIRREYFTPRSLVWTPLLSSRSSCPGMTTQVSAMETMARLPIK